MVSRTLTKKAAKKGKSIGGIPGMLVLGALVFLGQFFLKKKLKKYFDR